MSSQATFLQFMATISYLFSSIFPIQAELFACEDCCKSDQTIGITTFDSSIASDGPLTWSVASFKDDDYSANFHQYWRSFYLSTPLSLNLSDVTDFSGCGIYLYNITATLQVDKDFTDYGNFSCDTVMSLECQKGLIQQASDEVQLLTDPETYLNFTCGSLATRLAGLPIPESCSLSGHQPKWGFATGSDVAGKGFTLSTSMSPSDRFCNVTANSSGNTLIAESKYVSLRTGSEEARAFQNGTTPVLTMFFNRPNQAENATSLSEPEVHLSCLKTVPTEQEQKRINNGAGCIEAPLSLILALMAVGTVVLTGF